jgi:hypothetical protein
MQPCSDVHAIGQSSRRGPRTLVDDAAQCRELTLSKVGHHVPVALTASSSDAGPSRGAAGESAVIHQIADDGKVAIA